MRGTMSGRAVRPAYLADTWYPGGRQELSDAVDGYISEAPRHALPGSVVALVAPHAGYYYSGRTAGHAYAQVRGAAYGTVVLIGPAHRVTVGAYGIPAYDRLSTPLGQIQVDQELVEKLRQMLDVSMVSNDEEENSLEVQLPFLQRSLGAFTLLPIMMGFSLSPYSAAQGWPLCQRLGETLAEILARREDVLLVASTDLSHLPRYDDVVRYDKVFATLLAAFDARRLAAALAAEECHACGGAAVVAALAAAQARGADAATVVHYATSADVTGERVGRPYIVGYAGAVMTRSAQS